MKWEDRVHQQGANIIISELKRGIERQIPNINIISRRGAKIGADAYNQPKIQKVVPKDDMYDPVKKNLFFKDAIEIFKSPPNLEIMKNPRKFACQPNLSQALTSPLKPINSEIPRRHLEKYQSVINLWFQLFFDILGDDQLAEKLRNTLYLILGNEGTPDAIVRTNLPEKNTERIQRRKA
jgi:hypothetical protein